jgi:hypothetical protein
VPSGPACGLIRKLIVSYAGKFWSEMGGDAKGADERRIFKSITFNRGADWEMTLPRI